MLLLLWQEKLKGAVGKNNLSIKGNHVKVTMALQLLKDDPQVSTIQLKSVSVANDNERDLQPLRTRGDTILGFLWNIGMAWGRNIISCLFTDVEEQGKH